MLDSFYRKYNQIVESTRITARRISNIAGEIKKPKSFYRGEQFEDFTEEKLFPNEHYELIKRTDTYERNHKRFSRSTNDPDFLFECRVTNRSFAVEAKYRTRLFNDELSWCKKYQYDRYAAIDRDNIPVLVVVGLGGTSNKPEQIFLFPVREVKYINLYMSIAEKYELSPEHQKGIPNEFLRRWIK